MNYINKQTGLSVQIEESLLNQLCQYGKSHYPNEYGGLLIGHYSEDRTTAIIRETILPREYKGTRYSFERETEDLRSILEDYFKKVPSLVYLGEWHTHPDGILYPSSTDIKALQQISDHRQVNILNPILLILSINGIRYKEGFFIQFNGEIITYERAIC